MHSLLFSHHVAFCMKVRAHTLHIHSTTKWGSENEALPSFGGAICLKVSGFHPK